MNKLETIGRSNLYGHKAKLVGFVFVPHPTRRSHSMHVVFYFVEPNRWVIALGEVRGKGNVQVARGGLGTTVPGRAIAPYAQRQIEGATWEQFDEFKSLMNDDLEGEIEWCKA